MTESSILDFIQSFCCSCNSCIKSNCIVCTNDIVIDSSWKTNCWETMFSQTHSTMVRAISTDNNYTFDSMLFKLLNTLKLAFKLGKLRIACRLKESTTTAQDVRYTFSVKLENISLNHTSVSTINAEYFNSFRNCFKNNCTSCSVHARGISTTSQNSNTFHYS